MTKQNTYRCTETNSVRIIIILLFFHCFIFTKEETIYNNIIYSIHIYICICYDSLVYKNAPGILPSTHANRTYMQHTG